MVDGTIGYLYVHFSYKFHDYCKYLTITPIANTLIFDIWINLDTWKRLPADIQKIYEETWQEFFPQVVVKYTDQEVSTLLKTFHDTGGKLVELTPDQYSQWKMRASFLRDEYIKKVSSMGVDGQKLIADFEKLYQKHARKK